MIAEKMRTWKDNWNNVVRDVLFTDEKLRQLMLIPEDCTITRFRDKYFVEGEGTNEIMTDEDVRILCYDSQSGETGNKNVFLRYKEFDIYVKRDVLFNATDDRLQRRYDLIADRIKYLLCRTQTVCGIRFRVADPGYNLFTKLAGYDRFHVSFSYKTTV